MCTPIVTMAAAGTARRIVSRWSRSLKSFDDLIHVAAKPAKPGRRRGRPRPGRAPPRRSGAPGPGRGSAAAVLPARQTASPEPENQALHAEHGRRRRQSSRATNRIAVPAAAPRELALAAITGSPRSPLEIRMAFLAKPPRGGTPSPVHPTPGAGPDGAGWTGSGGGRKAGRRRAGAERDPFMAEARARTLRAVREAPRRRPSRRPVKRSRPARGRRAAREAAPSAAGFRPAGRNGAAP